MKPLLAAIRFLTIVPVPGVWGTAEQDLARSVPWFPAIGLLLGGAAAGLAWALSAAPPMLAAAVLVVVLLSFSGCLHMDGLADTADGFLSSRPRERILEIMKDSHIGAMGVIAIVCLLLVKFAALAALPAGMLWPTVLLMPLAGRLRSSSTWPSCLMPGRADWALSFTSGNRAGRRSGRQRFWRRWALSSSAGEGWRSRVFAWR